MPVSSCPHCSGDYHWSWEDAFDKFGFGDGDGIVKTEVVAEVLRFAGYTVRVEAWGIHNVVIDSIVLNGVEQIPADINFGYDSPRRYLPVAIVHLLDHELPEFAEVQT